MYCTLADVRAMAQAMTVNAVPPATDDLVTALIERVSRFFDMECGVADGYFESAIYPRWQSLHVYVVGDTVTPTTPNAHNYRLTTAGTSGASEPTWPTSGTVTNGSVVFTENGADVVATAKVVYGDGTNYLKLPPYVAGSLDPTITLPDGYSVPEFTTVNGYLERSVGGVLARNWWRNSIWASGWIEGVPVTVTAKWGFANTPADVKLAVIEWIINVWRETDPAGLKLTNLEGIPLREAIPPRVNEVARRWRLKRPVFI